MIQQINHLNFRTRNWVKIKDESQEMCDGNGDLKFKTSVIRSNVC